MTKANERQVGGDHYKRGGVELWDFFDLHNVPFLEACFAKYVCRFNDKDGVTDLEKAAHYLDKISERVTPDRRRIDVSPDCRFLGGAYWGPDDVRDLVERYVPEWGVEVATEAILAAWGGRVDLARQKLALLVAKYIREKRRDPLFLSDTNEDAKNVGT